MFSQFKIFTFSKNSFENQLPQERVIFIQRRHPVFVFLSLFFFLFLFFLPFFFWHWFLSFLFLSTIYWAFLWILFSSNLLFYFLSVFIVTNKRVIKIESQGFFKYQRSEAFLDKIQDITVKIEDPLATFLNFGKIEIQTAGTNVRLVFDYLPSPEEIKEEILKAKNEKL